MGRLVRVMIPELDLRGFSLRATVWHVSEGERLQHGDRLLEVATEGVSVDIASPADGRLRRRLVFEDETVVTGQTVALVETGEDI